MTRRLLIALLVAALGAGSASAFGKKDAGTSGAAFLKIGPGARPVGMGEAFTGVADDIHAIYWNPAGLTNLEHPEMAAMHMQWFQNISYEFAAFAYPTQKHGTWGMAITNLHTDDLQRRTEDTDTDLGKFSSSDNAYWVSYAYPVTDRLSLGGSAKYIRQSLDSVNANAYAFDGGILYDTDWHGLRLGGSIQNLGTEVKFNNESDPLPMTMRLGASIQAIPKRLLLSSDLIIPRDHEIGLAVGGEYTRRMTQALGFNLRSGYRSDSDVSGFSGFSLGAGLDAGRTGFDFTWVPFGELGNSYRYALHIKFGPTASEVKSDGGVMQKSSADSEPSLSFLEN